MAKKKPSTGGTGKTGSGKGPIKIGKGSSTGFTVGNGIETRSKDGAALQAGASKRPPIEKASTRPPVTPPDSD